jgi:predicted transcriptional regulator
VPNQSSFNIVDLTINLAIAWLNNQNNPVAAGQVPALLHATYDTILELADRSGRPRSSERSVINREFVPMVSESQSLASPDYILSLINGKPYKTLRRHLTKHGLTPEEYRARYHLPLDYPMVAPSYAEKRSDLAKELGLGGKRSPRTAFSAG